MAHRHHHHHHRHSRRKKAFGWLLAGVAAVFFVFLAVVLLFNDEAAHFLVGGQVERREFIEQRYDGIDVSHHQGIIDWMAVAQDTAIQFVYVKATEGSTHLDSMYERNIREANLVGLNVGSYHYLTSSSAITDQFSHFRRHVKPKEQKLRPMIDVEPEGVKGWGKKALQDSLALFCWYVKKHYGVYPIIYSYAKFYNEWLAPRFNHFNIFLARYNGEEPMVEGAGEHNIWQHTDQGYINGIKTEVDLDIFAQGTTLADLLISQ
ncbi:glycosyl hydrolase family 25 [Prevotella sp. oral taxon 376]|uniref:glycoside hydrolase family 25 protein n=1 Tax=Prevotella sp. oral taxon 376 TaxID=712466 RepID=UPI000D1F4021|nr:glycoside hydrolase family 25 protein [Prevotella sp. oral taxon 376]PTL33113.1 glycosyl hydrolase family 25 [Prevotella sp. oral taxon 376]